MVFVLFNDAAGFGLMGVLLVVVVVLVVVEEEGLFGFVSFAEIFGFVEEPVTVEVTAALTFNGFVKLAWANMEGTPSPTALGFGFHTLLGVVGDLEVEF
jgi:hypothetical protein